MLTRLDFTNFLSHHDWTTLRVNFAPPYHFTDLITHWITRSVKIREHALGHYLNVDRYSHHRLARIDDFLSAINSFKLTNPRQCHELNATLLVFLYLLENFPYETTESSTLSNPNSRQIENRLQFRYKTFIYCFTINYDQQARDNRFDPTEPPQTSYHVVKPYSPILIPTSPIIDIIPASGDTPHMLCLPPGSIRHMRKAIEEYHSIASFEDITALSPCLHPLRIALANFPHNLI